MGPADGRGPGEDARAVGATGASDAGRLCRGAHPGDRGEEPALARRPSSRGHRAERDGGARWRGSGAEVDKIATVTLAGPGTAEARYTSEKTLTVWSDWTGEWRGTSRSKLQLAYDIELLQGGKSVGKVSCDTSSVKSSFCSSDWNTMGHRKASCEVQMKCELPDTKPGEVTVRVVGKLLDPANTKKVDKMDLNLRTQ